LPAIVSQPPPTIHGPQPPIRDLRGGRFVHEAPYDIPQAFNVEPGVLAKVKADVIVRGRMRCAYSPRAAQRYGDDAGDNSDSV
jgi:hypothetical protein